MPVSPPILPRFAATTKLPQGAYAVHYLDEHGVMIPPDEVATQVPSSFLFRLFRKNPHLGMTTALHEDPITGTLVPQEFLLTRRLVKRLKGIVTELWHEHHSLPPDPDRPDEQAIDDQTHAQLTDELRQQVRDSEDLREFTQREEVTLPDMARFVGHMNNAFNQSPDMFEGLAGVVLLDELNAEQRSPGDITLQVFSKGGFRLIDIVFPKESQR